MKSGENVNPTTQPKKYFVKIQKGQFNCEEKRAEWNKCKAAIGKKKKESKGQDPC
jgi:hypothetical protein